MIETDFYSKSLDAKKSMNGVRFQDYDSYSLLKELIHKILMGLAPNQSQILDQDNTVDLT